jgi:transposase
MKRFVGLDLHKHSAVICVIDCGGKVLARYELAVSRESIEAFARRWLQAEDELVLEATTNTWAVVDLLRPFVARIAIANPLRVRAIAEARVKTDKIDAHILAQLLRNDFLPEVWIPDSETRSLRERCAERAALAADQTRIKNRLQSLLAQRLIRVEVPELFNPRGRRWLKDLELAACDRAVVESLLRVLDQLEKEQRELEKTLAQLSYRNESIRLLMTLPGLGPLGAQALYAALGDWRRFADGDHAASYLGLTPSTRQSAQHSYHGSITKAGNPLARWLLTQAARQVARHPGPLGVFFRRLCARKNHQVAVVATARKMVTIGFLMLKHHQPYRYSLPAPTQRKLAALRIQGSNQRRPKGKARLPVERREPGVRVLSIPALNEVYQSEDLLPVPSVEDLAPGERRSLKQMGIAHLPAELQKVGNRTYRSKANKARAKVRACGSSPSVQGPHCRPL